MEWKIKVESPSRLAPELVGLLKDKIVVLTGQQFEFFEGCVWVLG